MDAKTKSSIELCEKQIECLQRLADGQTRADIAHALSLSEITINLLIRNASYTLSASSTTHAVVISIKEEFIHI